MFTDMVGYTALMQHDEALAIMKRERHKEVLESAIHKFRGQILQYYGDGTLSIFQSALEGVHCAIEIQERLTREPKVDLRIGIHTGDITLEEEGIYGDGVNVASRIESLAVSGGVFISEKVYDDIKNQKDIVTQEIGSFELKNVSQPIRVFAISNPGFAVPSRKEIAGKLNQPHNRLAVLPFENLSGDPDNEYFSDGITEELIDAFSKVKGLLVTSRTSCFAFKKRHEDAREIGSKLNVDKILEGSVRRAGDRVRISAQLINATDGYHIWSETFNRDLHDIFELQDEIARIIVFKLRESISERPGSRQFVKPITDNLDAYSLYLKGVFFLNKLTPTDVFKAINYLEEAIKLDPYFAQAAGHLAGGYIQLGSMGQMDPPKAFELARHYADIAIELDNTSAEAYSIKGETYMVNDWDWKKAHEYLIKGLTLNPGSSLGSFLLAIYNQCLGKTSLAIDILEKALPYDPLSVMLIDSLCEKYFYASRFSEAEAQVDKLLELDPDMRHPREIRGFCHAMRGEWDDAIKDFEEVHRLTKHPLKGLAPLGYAYAKTGQIDKAMTCINKIEQRPIEEPGFVIEADLALVYWGLNERDKAFECWFRALDRRMPVCYGLYSPVYDGIAEDTRFGEIKRRMKLPVE